MATNKPNCLKELLQMVAENSTPIQQQLMPEETSHPCGNFHGFVLWLPEILKNTCCVSQELGYYHNIRLVLLKSLGSNFFRVEGYFSFRATNASFVFDYVIIQLQNKVWHDKQSFFWWLSNHILSATMKEFILVSCIHLKWNNCLLVPGNIKSQILM